MTTVAEIPTRELRAIIETACRRPVENIEYISFPTRSRAGLLVTFDCGYREFFAFGLGNNNDEHTHSPAAMAGTAPA